MKDELPQDIEGQEGEGAPTTEAPRDQLWKQRVQKLIWPVHARFPNFIPHPYGDRSEYRRDRDEKDNANSTLDEGVELKLACVMVSEVFGPSEIEILYDSLEKMGWDRERAPVRDDSNIEWLKKQRLYGSAGTLNIGHVCRPEDVKKYLMVRYTADFPREFSALHVNVSQQSPSITCLTIGFILSEEAALDYAREINRPAKTTNVRQRGVRGYSVKSVGHIKEERVRSVREKYRNLGIKWISKNFPGFFSVRCEQSHFPTAEFLSLDGYTPFDREAEKDRDWNHWPRFANLDSHIDVWTCNAHPTLKFSLDAARRDKTPNHITVGIRWDAISEDEKKDYGDGSLGTRTYFAYERLDGTISRLALISYLRELLKILKETRQSLPSQSKLKRSVSEVEEISAFFRRSIGVPSVAREVLALSTDKGSFRWNTTGFSQQIRPDKDEKRDISEALSFRLEWLARQLVDEDRDTREFLNQLSSAIGTKQSIAAQWRMEIVAVLALFVSIISMAVAAYAVFGVP